MVNEHSVRDIAERHSDDSVDMVSHRVYDKEQDEVTEIVERIEKCWGSINVDDAELIVLVFDRRNWLKIGTERLSALRVSRWTVFRTDRETFYRARVQSK